MNHDPEPLPASPRFVLAALLVFLLAGNGCGRKEAPSAPSSPGPTEAGNTPSLSPNPAIVSAEKTSFDQVTAQLDPGGSLYGYLSTSQWLEGLSGRINGWRDAVLSLPNLGEREKSNVNKAFDLITRLIKSSGVESISGVGVSGIALEKGFYQTKFVIGRDPNGASGAIWTLFGRVPRPLYELDWLPADTVWAAFSDIELGAIWSALVKTVEEAGFPELTAGLGQLNGVVQAATGKKLDELLGSLGGQCGVFLTLNSSNKISIPQPNGGTFDIAEPGLVIVLKVKDDTLFDWADRALKDNPEVIRSEEGGLRMRTMPIPLPLPVALRPTIARQGEHLFLAANDESVKTMMGVKAGKQNGLKSTAEFKRLAQGMSLDGNSFTFVSQRLSDTIQQVQSAILSRAQASGKEMPSMLMQKIYSINQPVSSFAVGRNMAQGWVTVGHGTQQPANAVVLPLVIAPTAILAGLTLPALAKAKGKAQDISCVNNLKQMGLAARIYATDNKNYFPPDFVSMKDALVSPKLLICPADANRAARANLTWDNFSAPQSSYEYVTHGLTESTPGLEKKILFRCRIHGHVCMGDGHVEQKSSGAQ